MSRASQRFRLRRLRMLYISQIFLLGSLDGQSFSSLRSITFLHGLASESRSRTRTITCNLPLTLLAIKHRLLLLFPFDS
ncbi:hypothetical protein PUNSTDRAFT_125959 [Punctularia strigosozonata HHB-11173 SS5]|uniref:uncharacterized protein n=1 Tax=Punctularia strigosozonata (strain HHB-11173) TaxID=741275 RepID=UPI0004416A63|nr:uncharacterized protein PUNSTDRAFT_125959 [Punctularia strigosozonata HHB-11173 SS5]EIN10018.1 hypothetical protein PUNSTDRAFT_125959 [Punctularia strigosozonata HHB-11173 SS5]